MDSAEQQPAQPDSGEPPEDDHETTTEDFEQDPARNPESDELEDVKGG